MWILKVFSGHWTAAGFYDFCMSLILISEWGKRIRINSSPLRIFILKKTVSALVAMEMDSGQGVSFEKCRFNIFKAIFQKAEINELKTILDALCVLLICKSKKDIWKKKWSVIKWMSRFGVIVSKSVRKDPLKNQKQVGFACYLFSWSVSVWTSLLLCRKSRLVCLQQVFWGSYSVMTQQCLYCKWGNSTKAFWNVVFSEANWVLMRSPWAAGWFKYFNSHPSLL